MESTARLNWSLLQAACHISGFPLALELLVLSSSSCLSPPEFYGVALFMMMPQTPPLYTSWADSTCHQSAWCWFFITIKPLWWHPQFKQAEGLNQTARLSVVCCHPPHNIPHQEQDHVKWSMAMICWDGCSLTAVVQFHTWWNISNRNPQCSGTPQGSRQLSGCLSQGMTLCCHLAPFLFAAV